MIANLLSTLLGIALVYCAVLSPSALAGNAWAILVAGVAVIVLALLARTGDAIKWFNTTNGVLGAALFALGAMHAATELNALVMFWNLFWIGSIVSVFSLWSALYNRGASVRPRADSAPASTASARS